MTYKYYNDQVALSRNHKWLVCVEALTGDGHYKYGDIIIAEREGEVHYYDEYETTWPQIVREAKATHRAEKLTRILR